MEKIKKITLILTENCNLNCVYCYEHYKNMGRKMMTFQKAKEIIDTYFADINEYDGAIVDFFGGEPFVNFQLLKKIYDYIEQQYHKHMVKYAVTTNGTLVHGDIQEWLRLNKEKIKVSLSLDGNEVMQDLNRPQLDKTGSFDQIDLNFFLETWKGECSAKMTVSEYTLPYLAEGVKYIEDLGFFCNATFAVGPEWEFERNKKILIQQLEVLVDYYSKNEKQQLCSLLNYDFRLLFAEWDRGYHWCGVGMETPCYSVDGEAFPCQGFTDVSLGNRLEKDRCKEESYFDFPEDSPCLKCRWVRLCKNCYVANLQQTGCMFRTPYEICVFNRLTILASSKIQFNRMKLKKMELDEDEMMKINAILIIQNDIMQDLF